VPVATQCLCLVAAKKTKRLIDRGRVIVADKKYVHFLSHDLSLLAAKELGNNNRNPFPIMVIIAQKKRLNANQPFGTNQYNR
jgi:hypothetical protein